MDLCTGTRRNGSHVEICHDESDCPLCEGMEKVKELEITIKQLQKEVDELSLEA